MRLSVSILLWFAASLSVLGQQPAFVPVPAEKLSSLLQFSGPVSLTLRVAGEDELAANPRKRNRLGIPLAAYTYSDPARTSESFAIGVFPVGEFMKEKRSEFLKFLAKRETAGGRADSTFGVFPAPDGRPIIQFPGGYGPGGCVEVALIRSRDPRFEVVVFQQTNFHDDEDPKRFWHHVTPQKELREVIVEIEALVIQ